MLLIANTRHDLQHLVATVTAAKIIFRARRIREKKKNLDSALRTPLLKLALECNRVIFHQVDKIDERWQAVLVFGATACLALPQNIQYVSKGNVGPECKQMETQNLDTRKVIELAKPFPEARVGDADIFVCFERTQLLVLTVKRQRFGRANEPVRVACDARFFNLTDGDCDFFLAS